MNTHRDTGRAHDFDFLQGCWHVTNRKLKQRHAGCTEWREFGAEHRAWSHLGGIVSVDEMVCPSEGFSGCSVRTFDLATRRWAIYWIDSRTGTLFPPVHGGWAGDRGEFFGDDVDEGRPVKVRFKWQRIGPDEARWEQAYSLDGGECWETNWVMEFRRAAEDQR